MIEVQPGNGHSRVVAGLCDIDRQPHADGPRRPSFSQLFELQLAVEELVSTALKDGSAICTDLAVADLFARGGGLGVSAAEMHEAIVSAASRAGVNVRTCG